ncbi:hypothetical protein Tco_0492318 [Tanacetum coccineum]
MKIELKLGVSKDLEYGTLQRTTSIRKSDTLVLEDLKALSWKTCQEGALMNVSIFVGTSFVITDFAVLEDIDAYRDNEMGDIIFGEPFLREIRINTKRFKGIITLYNGDNEVTYQMVRSHLKFKHHTNEQCNKIPPLLKDQTLSEFRQWKNGSYAGTLACMSRNKKRS